ncbi:YtcA family lipoprotein [Alloacidobacterium dinghuense]
MSSNHQLFERCANRRRRWMRFAISLLAPATVGCSRSPEFNILGSYFPSWLVCLAIAIPLTFLVHTYVTKKKLTEQLWPLPIVYSALLCLFSCSLWLILFG